MSLSELMPVIVIMGLLLIVLPVVMGRMSGKNPLELLLGKHVTRMLTGRGAQPAEDAALGKKTAGESAQSSSGKSGAGNPAGSAARSAGDGARNSSGKSGARNSTGQELMEAITAVISFARRNHYYCVVPGTVRADGGTETAKLSAILVTRCSVIGVHCFGYGGTVYCAGRQERWRQVLGGEEMEFDSPQLKNEKQKEILDAVVRSCCSQPVDAEVYGVFTAKDVTLKNAGGSKCCTRKAFLETLGSSRYQRDAGISPKELGKAIEKYVMKQ